MFVCVLEAEIRATHAWKTKYVCLGDNVVRRKWEKQAYWLSLPIQDGVIGMTKSVWLLPSWRAIVVVAQEKRENNSEKVEERDRRREKERKGERERGGEKEREKVKHKHYGVGLDVSAGSRWLPVRTRWTLLINTGASAGRQIVHCIRSRVCHQLMRAAQVIQISQTIRYS